MRKKPLTAFGFKFGDLKLVREGPSPIPITPCPQSGGALGGMLAEQLWTLEERYDSWTFSERYMIS